MAFSPEDPRQLFRLAAKAGDTDAVRVLLDHGVDIHAAPPHGLTAVILAFRANRVDTLRLLLERGARLPVERFNLDDAFLYAHSADLIVLLGRHGLVYPPAILTAAYTGNIQHLKLLLDLGVDKDYSYNGITALMAAAEAGELGVMEFLLQQSADIYCRDKEGRNALDHALKGLSDSQDRGQFSANKEGIADKETYFQIFRLLTEATTEICH